MVVILPAVGLGILAMPEVSIFDSIFSLASIVNFSTEDVEGDGSQSEDNAACTV